MPYVIQIGASNGANTAYYAGPTLAMGMATNATGQHGEAKTVFNVNAATRISWALPKIAEETADNLRRAGIQAHIEYDLPKPIKMLKWLFTP